jgi:hypothetical protein
MLLLRGGREDLLLPRPSALTNKVLLIVLSRAALMWTVHESSVDRRQTLIQAKSKSS